MNPDPSMSSTEADVEDPRVVEALRRYAEELDAGKRVNRQEFIARYPEIVRELSLCLQGLAFLDSAGGELKRHAGITPSESSDQIHCLMAEPLGDFRLVKEIGRGGMGVVYEAIQMSLGRRVALKLLPLAAALDDRHLRRFQNEAQAAAQLHHSHIVPVYAVGCERGVHYYAMQLIEGRSLAEVIRALRQAEPRTPPASGPSAYPLGSSGDSSPTGNPPPLLKIDSGEDLSTLRTSKRSGYYRAVARMGVEAAEALQYAHSLGIVHRDVKPANLLLDHRGAVWVTDFGLAQFYDSSDITQPGDVLGTLRYMSPEQANRGGSDSPSGGSSGVGVRPSPSTGHSQSKGRHAAHSATTLVSSDSTLTGGIVVDQRTDVYSLGLTLYELVTLERAVQGETRHEMLRSIIERDPRHPRHYDKRIPLELCTIILKATAKDPADRYPTARALAEDLQRFLRDEPIRARPPTLIDHAWKWVRRHRQLSTAIVVGMAIAVGTLAFTTVYIAREQQQTAAAWKLEGERAREAHTQRLIAQENFQQAKDAIDFLTVIATEEMPNDPRYGNVRRRLLEATLDYYKKFLDGRKSDAVTASELQIAEARVGRLLRDLAAVDQLWLVNLNIMLLQVPAVRSELQLTATQISSVEDQYLQLFPNGWGDAFSPLRNTSGTASRLDDPQVADRVMTELGERNASLSTLLLTAQYDRLKQISRQLRGVWAFDDPDVVEALSLSPAQREIVNNLRISVENRSGPGSDGPDRDGHGPTPTGSPNFEQVQPRPGFPSTRPGRFNGPSTQSSFGQGSRARSPFNGMGIGGFGGRGFGNFGGGKGDMAGGGMFGRGPRSGGSILPRFGPFSQLSREAVSDFIPHLTPVQAEIWRALSGSPFDISRIMDSDSPPFEGPHRRF